MQITIKKATNSDYKLIKNLVPYYIYDMSEYMEWNPNKEGRYDGCDDLHEYWKKENHHAYLIIADNKIAGFAMIRPCLKEKERMEIGEFFILRKFSRKGIGKKASYWLFNQFPGLWLVRVLNKNIGALRFWERVILDYTENSFNKKEHIYECSLSGKWQMQFFRFESNSDKNR